MPTNYDGVPGNIVAPTKMNIVSTSNTNPLVVTVSGALPIDFLTGVQVEIQGHTNNTPANGIWVATVTGGSTFSIPVAGLIGAGGATGTVQPLNLTPLYTVPQDGDPDNAASVFSSLSALGDRSQFLAGNTGYLKLAGRCILTNSFGPSHTASAITAASLTAGTWYQLLCAAALTVAPGETGRLSVASPGVPGQQTVWEVAGVSSQDILSVSLDANVGPANGFLALWWAITEPGISPSWPSGFTILPGSDRVLSSGNATRCSGIIAHQGTGTLWIVPAFYANATATYTVVLVDGVLFEVDAMQLTGIPQ